MSDWRDDIFEVFQDHDIKQVYHVPDAGHSRLIEACQKSNSIRTLALTTEEEGIPLAAGAWLGGQRSALLMQSSGVGNTINMMGMPKTLRFPFMTLITMRGEWGEFNSWQYPMGQGTPKVLEAMAHVVATCKAHNVVVGHPHVEAGNAERIIKEGYRFLMCAPVRSYGHLDKARQLAGMK